MISVNEGAERPLVWCPPAVSCGLAPVEAITTRPWRGPDMTTRLTVDQFRRLLAGPSETGDPWPHWVTRAAVSVCRSYGIKGEADPGYIANTIWKEHLENHH